LKVSKQLNGGALKKAAVTYFKVDLLSQHLLEGLRKSRKSIYQASRSTERYLNQHLLSTSTLVGRKWERCTKSVISNHSGVTGRRMHPYKETSVLQST